MDKELKAAIEALAKAFEDFKAEVRKELEAAKKGIHDPVQAEVIAKMNAAITESQRQVTELQTKAARPGGPGASEVTPVAEYKAAFLEYLRRGGEDALRKAAGTIGTSATQGYTVPEDFDKVLGEILLNENPMRGISNVVNSANENYVKLYNTGGSDSGWVGETDARPQTAINSIAKLTPVYGEIYANVYATQRLLEDSAFNIEQMIATEAGSVFATQENDAFTTGTGTNKPKGVLAYTLAETADASRAFGTLEKLTTATQAVLVAPELITAVHKLKPGYRANAKWVMPTLTVAMIRKFTDAASGQFLWQPGLAAGQPQTLLGFPVVENEAMAAWAGSSKGIMFGDFKRGYTVADVGTNVQLRDPFTQTPYVRFYFARRVGGFLSDSNAIKVIVAHA